MKCEICGKEFAHLGLHINYQHKDITQKEYYDKYLKHGGEGFCFTCGSPLPFINLTRGYKHYCNPKCELGDPRITEKARQTYKEKTGYEHNMHNPESKAKVKNTNLEKYGGTGFAVKELAEKSLATFNTIHNMDIKSCNMIVHDNTELEKKRIETRIKNNNGKYISETHLQKLVETSNTPEVIEKRIKTRRDKYGKKYVSDDAYKKMKKSPLYTYSYANMYTFVPQRDGLCKCHCNICGNDYEISLMTLRTRHYARQNPCIICNPLEKQYSNKEKELLEFIKENYIGEVLENERNVLHGKEIDIYLPELKTGFEFDGTFWHADPRFYNADDIIKEQTAKQIWENDNIKNKLAKSLGIKLIRIKEYDWINNQEKIKDYIKSIIM